MTISIHEVISDDERRQVFMFRYKIYAEELGKRLPGMDHKRKVFSDGLDEGAYLIVAVDRDAERIVGTIRTNCAEDSVFPQRLSDCLQIQPLIEAFGPESVSYTSTLMIDPGYRGTTVASLLTTSLYKRGLRLGYRIDICVAELALVHLYYQLGYRPYGSPFRMYEGSGLRMPMIFTYQDKAYLDKVRSPFRRFLPSRMDDGGEAACLVKKLYPECKDPAITPMEKRALWASMAHNVSSAKSMNFLKGFSLEEIQRLMRRYPNIRIKRGERLFKIGEKERSMGIILSGRLGITFDEGDDPHFVSVLNTGEICGETEALIGGRRNATLVALEDSEILILPFNLFEQLDKRDAYIASRLSMNLNLLLSSRLQAMNLQFMKLFQLVSHRYCRKSEQITCNGGKCGEQFNDSYSITTLNDPKRELKRLEKQAWMGREIELFWLQKIGCVDNCTFLDLGSGPGLTSLMLAQTYTSSKFIGVEPDQMLRDKAIKLAEEHGLSERCTFIKGRGEEIPLEDNQVDYCYARFVFQHVPNPEQILKELKRITRPGGIVIILDVDDEGVIVHPEPKGFRDFQLRTAKAQASLGGDRYIARKLGDYMNKAGLTAAKIEVAPVTSREIPMNALVDAAFSFKEQTLKRMKLWKDEDQQMIEELRNLSNIPGAWLFVPVFFAHAREVLPSTGCRL